jgi:hypothetical protein
MIATVCANIPRGAYGLRILAATAPDGLYPIPGKLNWPPITLRHQVGKRLSRTNAINDDSASIHLGGACWVRVERETTSATLLTPSASEDHALEHAFLSTTAAVFARWLGRNSFHSGSFIAGGHAWGLIGPSDVGKSSTLAALALAGYRVLTDDLLVLQDRLAFAGTRFLDLRPEIAKRLGLMAETRLVRRNERRRLPIARVEPTAPLAGWFYLSWGANLQVRPLDPRERLERLLANRTLSQPGTAPTSLLELAKLPAWNLQRPRRWSSRDAVIHALRALIGD